MELKYILYIASIVVCNRNQVVAHKQQLKIPLMMGW